MKTRVLTAVVLIAVLVPFFIFSDTVLFPVLMGLLGAIGVWEMQGCLSVRKHLAASVPAVLIAAGLPFLARYVGGDSLFPILFPIVFAVLTYDFIVAVFSGKNYDAAAAAMSGATTVYIAFGFASIVLLRDMAHGAVILYLAFLIPWVTDTFAYFCGRLFGKHKLIPEVSPKKTVEGSVGGTAAAILLTLLYGFVIGQVTSARPQYLSLAIAAAVVSLLSQCGDLIMSLIKRKYGIKDFGRLFPGHGGVLDRFDSILCTGPFLYFLSELVPRITLFS